jgi:hypothetical protein
MKPNNYGKVILTNQCQEIRVADFVKRAKQELKEALLQSIIESEGYQILLNKSKTGFGGVRYWFSCPSCQRRSGVLYRHPVSEVLGCRACLGLDYHSHRYKGMIESVV